MSGIKRSPVPAHLLTPSPHPDDLSGTVSILAAFAALVEKGFTPERGPVEFHWYAGEEGGLLGSLAVAKEYAERKVSISSMMEYDMTAFVKTGSTPTVNIISTEANAKLTQWVIGLAKQYCDIAVKESELFKGAGSDYMSFTRYGYPAAFGTEADPMAGLYDRGWRTSRTQRSGAGANIIVLNSLRTHRRRPYGPAQRRVQHRGTLHLRHVVGSGSLMLPPHDSTRSNSRS